LLSAAGLALWARVDGLRTGDLDERLWTRRTLTKAWCMRRTLHVVPANSLAMFARGTAGRADKEIRWILGRGVRRSTVDRALAAALEALGSPITRTELAERVARSLGVPLRWRTGGGWGNARRQAAVRIGSVDCPAEYLLHLLGAVGVVCSGPGSNGEATFVRADAWVRPWRDCSRERAEEALLRCYLRAFGPATVGDYVAWTRVLYSDARAVWERIRPELAPVAIDGQKGWALRRDLPALARAEPTLGQARLVPYFDGFLLGHLGREHLVERDHHPRVYRPQGWVAPVVLVDGRIAGTWRHEVTSRTLRVAVDPFRGPLPTGVRRSLDSEAERLRAYLGASRVELAISEDGRGAGPS
jgi:uncharacterized protein YcaQ